MKEIILAPVSELNIQKTFDCGQCFRWNADERGVYTGVAYGKALRFFERDGWVVCQGDCDEAFLRNYFDLDADYAGASKLFTEPEYLKTCAENGAGIHILRQEPWEALCSFIISQCNNIPRIKKIVETFCRLFGEPIGEDSFAFPNAEWVASLTEADLAPLRCGYRAAYILSAARAVCYGTLDFDELRSLSGDEALAKIKALNGVGDKVANCFMLYGLHKMERFPVDVWMRRALKEHFPENYDPTVLGDFAGLAQQYIFFYARSVEGAK